MATSPDMKYLTTFKAQGRKVDHARRVSGSGCHCSDSKGTTVVFERLSISIPEMEKKPEVGARATVRTCAALLLDPGGMSCSVRPFMASASGTGLLSSVVICTTTFTTEPAGTGAAGTVAVSTTTAVTALQGRSSTVALASSKACTQGNTQVANYRPLNVCCSAGRNEMGLCGMEK
jgi:hypothetical protein